MDNLEFMLIGQNDFIVLFSKIKYYSNHPLFFQHFIIFYQHFIINPHLFLPLPLINLSFH